ncbi:hypothetical protein L2E82_30148 [Cichorium intybus]|uniref:Uncharacterized protein n=1 Tax=Cichorium intybus TaxID=13427 RepID=A0ACB9D087_CICIN|nr:hypothetical protein L2E82_30148 [Cichorium intybus]
MITSERLSIVRPTCPEAFKIRLTLSFMDQKPSRPLVNPSQAKYSVAEGMWEVCITFVRGFQDLCKGCIADGCVGHCGFRFDLNFSAGKTCRNEE